jgi:hypothetical protein
MAHNAVDADDAFRQEDSAKGHTAESVRLRTMEPEMTEAVQEVQRVIPMGSAPEQQGAARR